jgi:IS605 OrfB family transposase
MVQQIYLMAKKQVKVVKVPVRIEEPDEEIRRLKYRALNRIMDESRFLGNMALRYYVAYRLPEVPKPVNPETGESIGVDKAIYNILQREKKHLPAGSLATLAYNHAKSRFSTDNRDAWAGRKSLPTYRSRFLIIRKQGTGISEVEVEGNVQFAFKPSGFVDGSWLSDGLIKEVTLKDEEALDPVKENRRLRLVSTFSWKDSGAREIVSRIVSGEYTMSDSQLIRRNKDLFFFLTYKFEPEQTELDPAKVCGVDLGVVIPAVCALKDGPQRAYLGDGGDVWAARSKFRAQRRREQRRKGLYSKSRKWMRSAKEDNWIHTYYHALTREVIKFCLQHGCGTIHMEDLTKLRQRDVLSEYRRLMWVPSKFHEQLAYKAAEAGIEIIRINPRNTSKRCSQCGHISRGNRRNQAHFVCEECGDPAKPVNADYNAARNIALAEGDVIEKGYREDNPSALEQMDLLEI